MTHPGNSTVDVKASSLRQIVGRLPTSINIIRIVAGLALPVSCVIVQGFSVGSCSYNDVCKDVMQDIAGITTANCPAGLVDFGINCTCPFDIPAQSVDGKLEFDIPDLSTTIASFLASGDFDITATVNNASNQHVACLRFKLTIDKAL